MDTDAHGSKTIGFFRIALDWKLEVAMATSVGNPLSYLGEQLVAWKQAGTYQRLRVLESESAAESRFDGREVINLASNNYLGLTTHPRLREAAIEATRRYGVGSGAVRTISGTMSLHVELEERIARFKNVEACVVFQSGFAANAGTVAAILTPDDHIISDELNHASIIDGCRLSKAKIHVFPHKDAAAAGRILNELSAQPGRKLLITDGVFSMDGDIAPLPALVEAAERYGAIMMVDDAHSSGVLGRNGRGTIDHFGVHGRVHIQVGTLSKAIGVLGGYVCGSRDLIEFLYHRARPFLFSTSHPPSVAASCIAAFDVLEQEPERIENLWKNTRYFKQGLTDAGFDTGMSETPITPVMAGEAKRAHELSRQLFQEGVLATGIGFPTVPEGKARVRTIVTATHTREELDRALEAFRKAGKRMGLI
jgi:glycine C-acetyltransferase